MAFFRRVAATVSFTVPKWLIRKHSSESRAIQPRLKARRCWEGHVLEVKTSFIWKPSLPHQLGWLWEKAYTARSR
jgi:hypothetical protein